MTAADFAIPSNEIVNVPFDETYRRGFILPVMDRDGYTIRHICETLDEARRLIRIVAAKGSEVDLAGIVAREAKYVDKAFVWEERPAWSKKLSAILSQEFPTL